MCYNFFGNDVIILEKNGFTLIELLAVILVLGMIIVFAIPAINGSGSSSREKISELEKKNLIEAGKMLALDLDESTTDIYNCNGWIENLCTKSTDKWSRVTISVKELINHGYFIDYDHHIDEDIMLIISGNHEVSIED